MAKKKSASKPRLTAKDWEIATLRVIADKGITSVAVEPLARDLKVTKGSFYWHFKNRDALLEAALARWEVDDLAFIQGIDPTLPAIDRLKGLFRLASEHHPTHKVYTALFHSPRNDLVSAVLERVNKQRLSYLGQAFAELGLEKKVAQNRALLSYSAYVGFLQLASHAHGVHLDEPSLNAYVDHMIETLIPEP